jgi:Delta14-sterol reductase
MIAVFVLGYVVFRGSNKQKHDYKHNPQGLIWGKKPVVVGRLLASGWWGLSRHPNYWGDIMLGIAYSLPCGFSSVLPWAYPIYLTLLLVHRFVRDDERCSQKYKEVGWESAREREREREQREERRKKKRDQRV